MPRARGCGKFAGNRQIIPYRVMRIIRIIRVMRVIRLMRVVRVMRLWTMVYGSYDGCEG